MNGYRRWRAGAWRLSVYAGTDPATGKEQRIYATVHAPNNRTGERAADQALAKLITEVAAGDHQASDDMPLAELLERWQQARRPDWSPKTAAERRRIVDVHLLPELGAHRIDRLKPIDLQRYLAAKRSTLSPSTVAAHAAVLRAALNLAVRWDLIARNPMDRVDPVEVPRREMDTPPMAKVAQLMHDLEATDLAMATYVRIAALTGARRGQMCALRWSDVDWDRHEVLWSRALSIGDDGVTLKGTKTGRRHPVGLDERTLDVLGRYRAELRDEFLALGAGRMGDDAWMFPSPVDPRRPVRPDSMSRTWRRLREAHGLEGVRLHDLRHFVGSEMIGAGEDLITVSGRLGHARTSTTTDVYGHRSRARDHEAAQRFADMVDAADAG